jgi:hypothetical protein
VESRNIPSSQKSKLELIEEAVSNNFDVIQWKHIDLSEDDAKKLSTVLTASPTVVSRTPDELIEHSKKFWGVLFKDKKNWEPVGYISIDIYSHLYKWKNIHERISLWVSEELQNKGYWIYLMDLLTKEYSDNPIVSCTLNPKFWHINTSYLDHIEVTRDKIPVDLFRILEIPGALADPEYRFYMNNSLYLLMQQDSGSI